MNVCTYICIMYEIDSKVIFLVMVITFLGRIEGLLSLGGHNHHRDRAAGKQINRYIADRQMDIYVCISSEMRMCMSVCLYNQLVPSFALSVLYFIFMDSHTCNMVRKTNFNFILCISTSTCSLPRRTRGRGGSFGSRTPRWTRPCSARGNLIVI